MRERSQGARNGGPQVWSIGIFGGRSPFDLAPLPGIDNPVLTADDIRDVPAGFVADPFMIHADDTWFMFLEVMNRNTRKGEIALAKSEDGFAWSYQRVVLAEPFHISYPCVFKWNGVYFMIPETRRAGAIRLYRADSFPDVWHYAGDLLCIEGADPSVFQCGGRWWMFVCAPASGHETLRLYLADALTGPWSEHPCSPIISGDPLRARSAGRVTCFNGMAIRYAQECHPHYGTRVRAFEIVEITPETYVEREIERPVLAASGSGWNQDGMHHIDAHLCGDEWIACVDGWRFLNQGTPRDSAR